MKELLNKINDIEKIIERNQKNGNSKYQKWNTLNYEMGKYLNEWKCAMNEKIENEIKKYVDKHRIGVINIKSFNSLNEKIIREMKKELFMTIFDFIFKNTIEIENIKIIPYEKQKINRLFKDLRTNLWDLLN